MKEDKKLKLAIIAGAAAAAKYLKNHNKATPDEAISHVSENINSILTNIDNE